MAKRGRPTTATPKAKQAIVDRLSEGEPLAHICRDDDLPAVRTVSDWMKADPEFSADFARARDIGHDAIAARLRTVAAGGEGSSGDVTRDRLIVETDLKLLAKWDKRYSDKMTVESKKTVTHRYDLDAIPDAELDQLERILAHARGSEGGEGEAVAPIVH